MRAAKAAPIRVPDWLAVLDSGFLGFMVSQILQVIFKDGHALGEGDVVVAQVGDDDGEAEEHDEEYAASQEEEGERGVGKADEVADGVEQRAGAGEDEHGRGGHQPAYGILDT